MRYKEPTFDISGTPLATMAANLPQEDKIGDVYKELKLPVDNVAEERAAIDTGAKIYKEAATAPVDEQAIRNNMLSTFQSEIDANNQIFAEKLREAKTAGLSRLGSGRAISARSGTLGSDFGNAQNDKITSDNAAIENAIMAERAAKIAEITGRGNSAATAEIAAKRKAQQEGLDSYIKYLGAKGERRKSGIKSVASALIEQNLKPEELDPTQLREIAATYGITTDELLSGYQSEKKTYDENKVKEAAAAMKDSRVELSEGQALYTLDPKTGQYVRVASNPKAPSEGTKNPITIAEAKSMSLPLSVVGQSQDTIIASLSSEEVPLWFKEKAQSESGFRGSHVPEYYAKLWNEYRKRIQEDFELVY